MGFRNKVISPSFLLEPALLSSLRGDNHSDFLWWHFPKVVVTPFKTLVSCSIFFESKEFHPPKSILTINKIFFSDIEKKAKQQFDIVIDYIPYKIITPYQLFFLCCTLLPCNIYFIPTGLYLSIPLSHLAMSSAGKESACNARDPSLIPGSGKSLGEGTGCPLQYSCLENPIERGAWQAIEHGVAKSQTQLSN